jgi:putative FmdB family regulatory protein
MPLYDYECPACSTIKEVQHAVSEIGKIKILCENCNTQMRKMLSLPALIGFDSVGRSRSRKDKEESSTTGSENSGSSKSESSKSGSKKSEAIKKEPASRSAPKNDSTA